MEMNQILTLNFFTIRHYGILKVSCKKENKNVTQCRILAGLFLSRVINILAF